MGCMTGCAFWFSTFSVSFMVFSFIAPLWLGRVESDVTYFYGLWYNLECFESECTLYSDVFDSDTVPLFNRTWAFNIVVIAIMCSVGLAFAVVATLILEILRCRPASTGDRFYYSRMDKVRGFLSVAAFLLWVAALCNGVAAIIGMYVADEYYTDNNVNYAAEFPWCLLSIVIATVMAFIGAILYTIIVCNWHKYADHYDYSRWSSSDNSEVINGGYYKSNSRYGSSFRETRRDSPKHSSYSVPAFSAPLAMSRSVGQSSSWYGKSGAPNAYGKSKLAGDRYFDYRLSRHSASASDIVRSSRRSLHDSPRILRSTNMTAYVRENDDYLNRLRESRRQEEVIDPYRLSVVSKPYRGPRDDDFTNYSQSRSEISQRGEPNVLDILYRESRRNTHL